jgi:DNA-binding NtrC family response regulator/tetratricopeptide (TPR) repeat protein
MAHRSVQQLVREGEYRKAAEFLDSQANKNVPDKLLRASLELHLGEPTKAYELAHSLLSSNLDASSRVQALVCCGRALSLAGGLKRGVSLLQKAIKLASNTDLALEAEVRAIYAQHVLLGIGVEPAVAELPRLRDCALRSGNRTALVSMHITRGRIAALRGYSVLAIRELEHAERLLADEEDIELSWLVKHVRVAIAIMEGDASGGITWAEHCLELARRMGSRARIGSALGNLAMAWVAAGSFVKARKLLEECLYVLPRSSRARLAALHTGIHLALLTDNDNFAERMIADGAGVIQESDSEPWYYRLWFEVHRQKWLLKRGLFAEIAATAQNCLAPTQRLADKELHDRWELLAAEALSHNGNFEGSRHHLQQATLVGRTATLPYLIEMYRVAGVAAARENLTGSNCLFSSATDLAASAGLLGLKKEVEETAKRLCVSQESTRTSGWDLASILNRLGIIIRLGRHPRVLGLQLLNLLSAGGLFHGAYLVEERSTQRTILTTGTSSDDAPSESGIEQIILLGSTNGATFWLHARVSGASEQIVWSAVHQLVTAAQLLPATEETAALQQLSLNGNAETAAGMVVAADRSVDLLKTTQKLAPSNITVLIAGETGTGKELFARALHDLSPRNSKPFIPYNCSAVSKEMLDAQLFGYRKGAFTGATEAFPGVIRSAAGGTLFLDEIGEVALDVQPKLLRFLESGEIHPLGEPRPIAVDVRVVAATNADLEKLVEEGRFREDLFYRLNVVRLSVPPLRERREEIPPLVQHYLDKSSRESHKSGIRIADETMEYLILFRWPGNVRQLANEIRRMVALAESNAVLMPEHLSHDIASSRRTIPTSERVLTPHEFVVRMDQPMSAAMEHVERAMIQYALALSGGRVEDAAERLGVSRKGLYLKRQRLAEQESRAQAQASA